MSSRTRLRRVTVSLAIALASALALGVAPLAAPLADATPHTPSSSGTETKPRTDTTSALERRRVDSVPTPTLDWQPCVIGECTKVKLPLDYDQPEGATVDVGLARVPARKPDQRIGSLFLNPGGPGGSATEFVQQARAFFGADVLDRFDLIGMDPRGSNSSTNTQCFRSLSQLDRTTGTMTGMIFPVTDAEESRYTEAASRLAMACSTNGRQLASAVSTAQVARDMDVVRRAVGDERLSYLGFSYGSYLGQVYANMFPDRVRAVAIDGVIDPREWGGTSGTANLPMTVRIDSAGASSDALTELFHRCAASAACPIPDPEAAFGRVAERLLAEPFVIDDPAVGPVEITYQTFIVTVLLALYSEEGAAEIPNLVAELDLLLSGDLAPAQRFQHAAAYRRTVDRVAEHIPGYVNAVEFPPAVMCSDGRNPWRPSTWAELAEWEDARAPWFGRYWLWLSAPCAEQFWDAKDEDAYTGPFDKVTAASILVVGNHHDPATRYAAARSVARLLPNSRLLSSTNWGHTAYGVSGCVTEHVDRYLLAGNLPPSGTLCDDGRQPFSS